MSNQEERLFKDFPPITTQEWMDKIVADLKGADFQKKLVWKTNEGFNVNPFYRAEDIEGLFWTDNQPGQFPYVRSARKDNVWFVRQDINVTDFAEANKKALTLLTKGITSFGFSLPKQALTAANIATLLDGISPEKIELNFRTCISCTVQLARLVVDYITTKGFDVNKCYGSVEFDPFRKILKKGFDAPQWADEAAEIVSIAEPLPNYRVVSVAGNMFSDAGAYSFQELGYSLAYGNEILAKLIEKGIDAKTAAKKIKFELGIGPNYFMEIAKFRAARWLWAMIVDAYKPESDGDDCPAKINVHARTSRFNQTSYDPHVNMLRTQTEAMSATIAGVDSLTVLPFDAAYTTPDEFSERIAVNQQLLLKEESHFDKIIDPSAGSYYIENLTRELANQAWALFLQTEEAGFYESLKAGTVQDAVNASAVARFKALSSRREILLGTNQYPNFNEAIAEKVSDEQTCGCKDMENTPLKSLNKLRLADAFNNLRLETERSGKTPKVFMLTIGNLAMRLARSQFSSNFFACAGYQVIDNLGFKTVEEGVAAARAKNADVIVLCSSDDEYATLAPEAYNMIKNTGHEILVIAGAPECMDDLKAQGIEHFINVRSNVLETLKTFNGQLLRS